jgi:DNA repair protein RadC
MSQASRSISEIATEALDRARTGEAVTNYPAIYEGFTAKGIAEADIKPRENVFTFHAWKALGRSVKRGEHGVKVVTWIDCTQTVRDPSTGEEKTEGYRRPQTTTVFHISQTEPTVERETRLANGQRHSQRGGLQEMEQEALLAHFAEIGAMVRAKCLDKRPAFDRFELVKDYLYSAMAFEPVEQFRVLFLDKRNRLIADEIMNRGTIDHTPVYPRELVKRALEHNAACLVLAHNHPSGDPTPSRADIEMTKAVVEVCKAIGIAVHDHIIVGRDDSVSLKQRGWM